MEQIRCLGCGKKIDQKEFFCPYCSSPIELEEEDIRDDEEEPRKQSGFGIASFILSVIAISLAVSKYSINGWLAPVVIATLQMFQNILCIIAFIFGTIGMLIKNRKSGFSIVGNITSFVLFFI